MIIIPRCHVLFLLLPIQDVFFQPTNLPGSCSVPPASSPSPRPMKMFEVAEVVEEVDSPPLSDLSAQSSLENVASLLLPSNKPEASESRTHEQQQRLVPPPPMHRKVVGGLESASDSQIGAVHTSRYLSESCAPEPTGQEYYGAVYPPYQLPPHISQSYQPHHYRTYSCQWGHPQQHPLPNLPATGDPLPNTEHYNTTSYLPLADQRHSLSSGVYVSSVLPTQHSVPSTVHTHPHLHSSGGPSAPSPQPPPPTFPQAPMGSIPSFSDVPHADLLAKAFMTFLHSIGTVFRDPAFEPLLQSLDQHFERTPHDRRESSGSAPPPSPPVSPQQPLPEKAEGVNVTPLEETVLDSCSDDMEKELLK